MQVLFMIATALILTPSIFSQYGSNNPSPRSGIIRPQYAISVTLHSIKTWGGIIDSVKTDWGGTRYVGLLPLSRKVTEHLGTIIIELFPDIAPKHVANFDSLVAIGFYNGTTFHRVVPNFVIQGGDPNSKSKPRELWGYGDPSQKRIPAEFSTISHRRGILSAARAEDPNSATSQFFICVADAPWLDGQYTVFGRVLEGMDVVDIIANLPRDERDNPIDRVEMTITKLSALNTVPMKR